VITPDRTVSCGSIRKFNKKPTNQPKNKGVQTMAQVKVKPLGDRVLLESIEVAEQVKGGIVIPDSAKEKPQEYKVVALGTGKTDDKGKKIAFDVKVGDLVLTNKYGGTEVKVEEKEYKLVSADDILAVLV